MKKLLALSACAALALAAPAYAAGSSMDPNGERADLDSRGTMDPDGAALNSRGTMDPDGGDTADRGVEFDPNGLEYRLQILIG
jgi:hypothetical protein